jgi:hypothetical protein
MRYPDMYIDNEVPNGKTQAKRGKNKGADCDNDPIGNPASGRSSERAGPQQRAVSGETIEGGTSSSSVQGGSGIDGGSLKELIRQGEEHLKNLSVQIELWKSMLSLIEED